MYSQAELAKMAIDKTLVKTLQQASCSGVERHPDVLQGAKLADGKQPSNH